LVKTATVANFNKKEDKKPNKSIDSKPKSNAKDGGSEMKRSNSKASKATKPDPKSEAKPSLEKNKTMKNLIQTKSVKNLNEKPSESQQKQIKRTPTAKGNLSENKKEETEDKKGMKSQNTQRNPKKKSNTGVNKELNDKAESSNFNSSKNKRNSVETGINSAKKENNIESPAKPIELNKEKFESITIENNDTTKQNNDNQVTEAKVEVTENHIKEETKKPEIKKCFDDVTKDNWDNITKFLNKPELLNLKALNKKYDILSKTTFKKQLTIEITSNEEKLKTLKEKNEESELTKPIPEFSVGRGALKALELLNQEKYKEVFKSGVCQNYDLMLPYKIYFILLNKPEVYLLNDEDFWKETCRYFINETKPGEVTLNATKNFDFSDKNIYKVFRLTLNKDKKLSSSFYTKLCQTTAIIIFLIRDALEYIGIITDKKNPHIANKLFKISKIVVESNNLFINHLN